MNINNGITDRNSESSAEEYVPLASSRNAPRPDLNMLYAVMLMIAAFGFIVIQTVKAFMPEEVPVAPPSDSLKQLEEISQLHPWLTWVKLGFLLLGGALLLIYIALRAGRIKPILQQRQNDVTWTLGALAKAFVIFFFLFVLTAFMPLLLCTLVVFLIISFMLRAPGRSTASTARKQIKRFLFILLAVAGFTIEPAILDDLTEINMQLIGGALIEILAALWILAMLKAEYGAKLSDIGIKLKGFFQDTGYGIIVFLAIFPAVTLVGLGWRWLGKQMGLEQQPHVAIRWLLETESLLTIVLVCLSAVVLAPLLEEFFFRGFVYSAFRKRLGFWPAIIISSAFFALIHMDFFAFLPIMILGMALAFLFERRQSLTAPVVLHFLHNAWSLGLVLYLKYVST